MKLLDELLLQGDKKRIAAVKNYATWPDAQRSEID
jgi:hypothetical protein